MNAPGSATGAPAEPMCGAYLTLGAALTPTYCEHPASHVDPRETESLHAGHHLALLSDGAVTLATIVWHGPAAPA